MKTSSRPAPPLSLIAALIATILPVALLMLGAQTSLAGSASWLPSPPSNDWNTTGNWTAGGPPNGSGNTATFALSNTTGVSISANTEVNGIVFNAGASAFTITASPTFTLTISGVGITNNSGIMQNFVGPIDGAGHIGTIAFTNSATAGSLTTFTNNPNNGGAFTGPAVGETEFFGTSTAGNGTFSNNGSSVVGTRGGQTVFLDSSTAGNGTFTTQGALDTEAFNGRVLFIANSTAGNGTFTLNGGAVTFHNTSTAGNGTFTSNTSLINNAEAGNTSFFDTSTAGNGTFTNNGGAVSGARGGNMLFYDTTTAGNATLIVNGGQNGGQPGFIQFQDDSSGGTARVEVFGNGTLDISFHNAPGMTIGSIEGTGAVFLGGFNLGVGSNNLNTSFSGVIQDGGQNGGTGGSLTKIGSGTLTLSGANTYTGATTINSGKLEASHDGALGNGDVSVGASGAILSLQGGATNNYIFDEASLSVVTGSTVNLNYTGSPDVVGFLIVNGVSQPAGLYGGAASGAPHQFPQFTGAGTILVTTPVAVSRKLQGATNFDMNLPFAGASSIECRNGGANNAYQIITTFGFPVTFNSASVTSGTANIATVTGNGTATVTINLTGVTNAQTLTVTLSGVNYGVATGAVPIRMSVLVGDTNGNGTVNASDVSQTKAQAGQPITASNFREDVNGNGAINASDVSLVKSRAGTALP